MGTRWARFVRGWLTAGISVFLAALFHVAGGGSTPGLLGATVAVTLAAVVCVLLAGKSLSSIRLGISVVASQFAFHLLFGVGAGSAQSLTAPAHAHGAPVALQLAGGPAEAAATDASMWLAHAVAAIATILVIRRGEIAFWGLVELARAAWIAAFIHRGPVVASSAADLARVRSAIADRIGLRDLHVVLSARTLRGPPAAALPAF